jgi:hypothetical protein
MFCMADPAQWRDPHGLLLLGALKPFIEEHFEEGTRERWAEDVSSAILFASNTLGRSVSRLDYPGYPEEPICINIPDGHETAIAMIAMSDAGAITLNGHAMSALKKWLMYYPDHDHYSIGIRLQALLLAGVGADENWKTSDGRSVNLHLLFKDAVDAWRYEKEQAGLEPGKLPSDRLLHLAPALIVLRDHYPELLGKCRGNQILQEIFKFYESLLVNGEYWGFSGETFVTGHVMEQYALDQRRPPSFAPLEHMLRHQDEDGKFDLGSVNAFGVQVHGLIGLYRCGRVFDFRPGQ